MEFLELRKNKV